ARLLAGRPLARQIDLLHGELVYGVRHRLRPAGAAARDPLVGPGRLLAAVRLAGVHLLRVGLLVGVAGPWLRALALLRLLLVALLALGLVRGRLLLLLPPDLRPRPVRQRQLGGVV